MRRKGSQSKQNRISQEPVKEQILAILSKYSQGFNYKQIAKRLNINDPSEKQIISEILKELAGQGAVEIVGEPARRIGYVQCSEDERTQLLTTPNALVDESVKVGLVEIVIP